VAPPSIESVAPVTKRASSLRMWTVRHSCSVVGGEDDRGRRAEEGIAEFVDERDREVVGRFVEQEHW